MKRLFLSFSILSLVLMFGCEDSANINDSNDADMSANDEAIIEVLEADSTDLFFTALDDGSEDNFGNDPNWLGGQSLNKHGFPHLRFGRIAMRPTERDIEIVYNDDSTATAYINTRLEGKFVTLTADSSGDTIRIIRNEKPMVHNIERIVHLWKFRDRPQRRLNWRIRNISMAEGTSDPNSVEIRKMVLYPADRDSIVIDDPLNYMQDGVSLFTFPRWTDVRLRVTVRNQSANPVIFPEGTEATELVRLHFGRNRFGHHGRSPLEWVGNDENGDNVYEGYWTVMQFRGFHHAVIDVIDNGTILESNEEEYPYNSNTWATPYRVTPF